MANDTSPRLGRPRRHEPDDVRDLCVRAGIEVLRDLGLTVGLTGVTIDAAAVRSGFSRALAYRAWRDDDSHEGPQQRFHRAVIVELLSSIPEGKSTVADRVLGLLGEHAGSAEPADIYEHIASMTDFGRERLFAQVVATGTHANTTDLLNNSLWHTQISLVASLQSHEPPADFSAALSDGENVAATRWVDFYQLVIGAFGIRLKPHYTWHEVALTAAALGEGAALRGRSPDGRRVQRPIRTLDGGLEVDADADTPWTFFGVGLMGIIVEFCEADPEITHATDPTRC